MLFTGEMVKALLACRKTMTRRSVKTVPGYEYMTPSVESCPYGKPGDRLWVRETWREDYDGRIRFRADAEHPEVKKWKPGIHLKRVHARILLEVTAVRVERAQEISDADVLLEGIPEHAGGCGFRIGCSTCGGCEKYRERFAAIWVKINGLASWEANPLVWVVSFKVLKP